jgi:hypothetical protein
MGWLAALEADVASVCHWERLLAYDDDDKSATLVQPHIAAPLWACDMPAPTETIRVGVQRSPQAILRFRRACVTAQSHMHPWNSSRRAGLYVCVSTSESVPCSSSICFRRALQQRPRRHCGGTAMQANRPTAIAGWSDSNPCRRMRLPNSRPRELPPAIYRQARLSALGTSIALSVVSGSDSRCIRLLVEFSEGRWCCREGLNFRPRPYQGRALPLSYGSARCGDPSLVRTCPPGKRRGQCHFGPAKARPGKTRTFPSLSSIFHSSAIVRSCPAGNQRPRKRGHRAPIRSHGEGS